MLQLQTLSGYFYNVLKDFAESHPERLTNPDAVRFFICRMGRYYPIFDLSQRDSNTAVANINLLVFCMDPSLAPSPFTGRDFLSKPSSLKEDNFIVCPQINRVKRLNWELNRDFSKEGIFVINVKDSI